MWIIFVSFDSACNWPVIYAIPIELYVEYKNPVPAPVRIDRLWLQLRLVLIIYHPYIGHAFWLDLTWIPYIKYIIRGEPSLLSWSYWCGENGEARGPSKHDHQHSLAEQDILFYNVRIEWGVVELKKKRKTKKTQQEDNLGEVI